MKLAAAVLICSSWLLAPRAHAQEAVYASPEPGPRATRSHEPNTIHDTSEHDRPMTVSAMLYVPWLFGIGIAGKFGIEIPILKNGFISKLNDSVSLEPSLSIGYSTWYGDLGRYDNVHGTLIAPAISGLWNFHLKPHLRVYGAANVGANIYSLKYANSERDTRGRPYIELAGGVFYNFAERIAVRAEVGWYGPRVGLSFSL